MSNFLFIPSDFSCVNNYIIFSPKEKVEPKQAGSFGSFGKKAPPPKPALKPLGDIRNEVDEGVTGEDKSQKQETSKSPEEEDSMMKVMGFGSFSSTHKSNATGHEKSAKLRMEEESKRRAMRFDVESMFKSAAASAQQRNMEANLKLEEEGRAGLQGKTGFIVPAAEKEKSKAKENKGDDEEENSESDEEDSDDEDGTHGPMPPPPAPVERLKKSKKSQDDDDDSEDDDEDDEEGGGEDDPVNRLPWTHEIQLRHGE